MPRGHSARRIMAAAIIAAAFAFTPLSAEQEHAGFIENRGQAHARVTYHAVFGPVRVFLDDAGWTLAVAERNGPGPGPRPDYAGRDFPDLSLRGVVVRMRFAGARPGAKWAGETRLPGRHNWFLGDDPDRWVTDVPAFRRAWLRDVLPGVAAVARARDGAFHYDIVVEPGAVERDVLIATEGHEGVLLDGEGRLVMRTPFGEFVHSAPVAWEEDDAGAARPVACAWRIAEGGRVGFDVRDRDPSRRLVIDPGITWSTLLGGSVDEDPGTSAIHVGASGDVTSAGVVVSLDYPTTPGAYQTLPGSQIAWDAWVTRLTSSGALSWSTYFGGSNIEAASGLAVDAAGRIAIVGSTASGNLPLVNAFDGSFNGAGVIGWGDAFAARFDPAQTGGAQLLWSTYFGGSADERFNNVIMDAAGVVTAVGWTFSSNLPGVPPPNGYQPTIVGNLDGIIARFHTTVAGPTQLNYFTYLGGTGYDYLTKIVAGPTPGTFIVQGASNAVDYPTVNAFQALNAGAYDVVVSAFDPALPQAQQLAYSTYIGGFFDDTENGLAVGSGGRVTVGGWTESANFPVTPGAFDTTHGGGTDAFVVCLNMTAPPALQLVFGTFIGGTVDEGVNDLVLDASGAVYIAGAASSPNFPTTDGAFQAAFQGGIPWPSSGTPYDGFVAILEPTGAQLRYASYLGGAASWDFCYSLALDPEGNAVINGLTRSSDFPQANPSYNAFDDVFVVKADLLPAGIARVGHGTVGCAGNPRINVSSMPVPGNTDFAVVATGAPAFAPALVALSAASLTTPIIVAGLAVWVDLAGVALLDASADATGAILVPLPLPPWPGLTGLTGYAQVAWGDVCASGGVAGTCAIRITVQ